MVIVLLITLGITFFWMLSLMFKSSSKKSFVKAMVLLVGSAVGIYFCIVTPTSFIRHEYIHKDGTMTSVEYSISGDSNIINNIKTPVTVYGRITKVHHDERIIAKGKRRTWFTAVLDDGREVSGDVDRNPDIKVGNSMSMTTTYYPYYEVTYNININ